MLRIQFFFVTPQKDAVFGERMIAVLNIKNPAIGNADVI
jgi:hypothetical protein